MCWNPATAAERWAAMRGSQQGAYFNVSAANINIQSRHQWDGDNQHKRSCAYKIETNGRMQRSGSSSCIDT